MAKGVDTGSHPGRQVGKDRFSEMLLRQRESDDDPEAERIERKQEQYREEGPDWGL